MTVKEEKTMKPEFPCISFFFFFSPHRHIYKTDKNDERYYQKKTASTSPILVSEALSQHTNLIPSKYSSPLKGYIYLFSKGKR